MLDEGCDFLQSNGRGRDLTVRSEKAVSSKEEREVKGPHSWALLQCFRAIIHLLVSSGSKAEPASVPVTPLL